MTNYKPKKNQDLVSLLNTRKSEILALKGDAIKRSVEGYLAYYGVDKDKFDWRFKKSSELRRTELDKEEIGANSSATKKVETVPASYSCEVEYGIAYPNSKMAKMKTDELLMETEREFDFSVKIGTYSMVSKEIYSLLQNRIKSQGFIKTLNKAKEISAKKGAGFLHIEYINNLEEGNGIKINALDPDNIIVNPKEQDPTEGFIVRDYTLQELLARYPELEDFTGNSKEKGKYSFLKEKGVDLQSHFGYPYKRAEEMVRMYNNQATYTDLTNIAKGVSNYMIGGSDELASYKQYSIYCNSYTRTLLDKESSEKGYIVSEYYNILNNFYCIYINDIVIYEGDLPSPIKALPITPIYVNRDKIDYFGSPLSMLFKDLQARYDGLMLQQKFLEIFLGKTVLTVNDRLINSEYHEDGQINISYMSPAAIIHLNEINKEEGVGIQPISFNNGQYSLIQSEKADVMNQMNIMFTSIRQISIGSDPNRSKTTLETDPLAKSIITDIGIQLSEFATKLLNFKFTEYKELKNGEAIQTDKEGRKMYITANDKLRKSQQIKDLKDMEQERETAVSKLSAQISTSPDGAKVQSQIIDDIKNQAIKVYLDKANIQPQSEEELANLLQEVGQLQEINDTVASIYEQEGKNIFQEQMDSMAQEQIPKVVNDALYFTHSDIDSLMTDDQKISFVFNETQQEKANRINSFIASIKPFENVSDFVLNAKNILEELVLVSGFNPKDIMLDKQYDPAQIIRARNQKDMINYNINSKIVESKYTSAMFGQEISLEDLAEEEQSKKQFESQLKTQEIMASTESQNQADIKKASATAEIDQVKQQQVQEMEANKPLTL